MSEGDIPIFVSEAAMRSFVLDPAFSATAAQPGGRVVIVDPLDPDGGREVYTIVKAEGSTLTIRNTTREYVPRPRTWPTPDEAFAMMASRWREMSPANRRRAERWPHPAWEWRVIDSIPKPRRITAREIRARVPPANDPRLPLP